MGEQPGGLMYRRSYAEHLVDNTILCRDRERRALDRAAELLCLAEAAGPGTREAQEALDFAGKLWKLFVQDLEDPENDLPYTLKAEIISVGHWVIKEAGLIRRGESKNFRGMIEICAIVRDGLK